MNDIFKNVLITGGRGFIGVNLVNYISERWKVHVFDNLERSSPTGWTDDCTKMISGDILDEGRLNFAMQGITHVVHLAAYGSVVESVYDPSKNFGINVQGTFNVLKAAVNNGVKRFVFASTGGALIGDTIPPVDENSVPKPISPYGASKLCGEGYCHAFAKSYGIETVCLRFGNVYGPHSAHKKGAVTMFIKNLINDEPINIYGDGYSSRDYIHVDDLCGGIESALTIPLNGGDVFHIASGRETTVLELGKILCNVAEKRGHKFEFKPNRCGEVNRNFATYEKAREILNFEPNWDLEDGLKATWEWFIKQEKDILSVEVTDS